MKFTKKYPLWEAMGELLEAWRPVFRQERTWERAVSLAQGWLFTLGRRPMSRAICTKGDAHRDWSADYRLLSRGEWSETALLDVSLRECLGVHGSADQPFVVALDDTNLPKAGKKTPETRWLKDPQSPPFWINLIWGQRFIQVSALLRPEGEEGPCRAVPVRFQLAPAIGKPRSKASGEARAAWRRERRERGLAAQGVERMRDVRDAIRREPGREGQRLLVVVDGSYTNSTVLKHLPEGVDLLGRTRKDISLCRPHDGTPTGGRCRVYGEALPTPEQLLKDPSVPFQKVEVYFGGRRRPVRYKTMEKVLWRRGAGQRLLRLIVIAPTPYRLTLSGRLLYRQPAYLLTTALDMPVERLIQHYFDRFQIEQNHRDEKELLGLGEAQVRSRRSVRRAPAFVAALYGLLLLASLKAYGPKRTADYVRLPKWRRRQPQRASFHDILAQWRVETLRRQWEEMGGQASGFGVSARLGARPKTPETPVVDLEMAIAYALT